MDPRFRLDLSVPPIRFVGSTTSGWDGAFLAEWSAGPGGEIGHASEVLVIQHWLSASVLRPTEGTGSWQTHAPGVCVRLPGETRRVEWRDSPRARFLFVTPERVEAVLRVPWERSGLSRWRDGRHQIPFVEHVLAAMMRDLEAGYPAGALAGEALLVAVLQHLSCRPPSAPACGSGSTRRRLALVREHVEANLAGPLPVAELAAIAGLGVRRFGTVFAAETGWPPHRYVVHRRIERAKTLMNDPRQTLARIACAVGFSDPTQLSRVFRQYTGVAPREYRRR